MAANDVAGRRKRNSLIWGGVFFLIGLFLLLVNNGVLDSVSPYWQYVVAGLLAVAGVAFLVYFLRDVTRWWPIIPAFTLITTGVIIFLTTQTTIVSEMLGSILFFGIALAFAVIYLLDRQRWWAIIPMGVLLLVSGTTAMSAWQVSARTLSATLFIGMGAVFLLVYLLGPLKREVWWALAPATALIAFGLFTFVFTEATSGFSAILVVWWPVLLLLLGVALLVRGLTLASGAPLPSADLTLPPLPEPGEMIPAPGTAVIQPQDRAAAVINPSPAPDPALVEPPQENR